MRAALGSFNHMSAKCLQLKRGNREEFSAIPFPETEDLPAIPRKLVGVMGASASNGDRLFSALSDLFPIDFQSADAFGHRDWDAVIVLDGDSAKGVAAAAAGLPSLVVSRRETGAIPMARGMVCFGDSRILEPCLRNQTMAGAGSDSFSLLAVETGDDIVASVDGRPVWLARCLGKATCQIVAAPATVLRDGKFLIHNLAKDKFLQLLPLLNFLRQLVKDIDWRSNSLPACLVVDDPSPYRPSYGHLNFRRLAEHATAHNYFVSLAVIPLDTWWVHRDVAETLRSFHPRMSIIFHGNDHTSNELLVGQGGSNGCGLRAAQAVRRMDRLRERHGLDPLKVMEPPHGVIGAGMLPHLLALGFEASLGTTDILIRYNATSAMDANFGLDRSHFLAAGLPVLPRIKMTPDWRNDVIFAAFLRQPIIIALHHWDFADGSKLVAEIAGLINQLGATWMTPLEIARTNYKEMRKDKELEIKSFSLRFNVAVPAGITSVRIHRPWLREREMDELIVRQAGRQIFRSKASRLLGPIPVRPPCLLEIVSPPATVVDHRATPAPRLECWPVVRKVLMEARDRSGPMGRCVAALWNGERYRLQNAAVIAKCDK